MTARKRPLLIPYLRKSSGEDPAASRDRQRAAINGFADMHGLELADEIFDAGVSGSRPWRERSLGRAVEACEQGDAAGIIVEDSTRLSREGLRATAEIYEALARIDARLVCVAEGIDTKNGDQELNLGLRAILAREQWKQYERRMRHVKERAVDRGVHISGTVPVGYTRPGRGLPLERNDPIATAVELAFELRASGMTLEGVGRELDEAFPGGPSGRGAWSAQSLGRLLRNRAYLGEARHGKLSRPGSHPALVDRETFDAVQALRQEPAPRRGGEATKSLLAGIVKCGGCGYALDRCELYGQGRRGRFQYRCRRKPAAGPCRAPASMMLDQLDAHVLDRVRAEVAGRELREMPRLVDVAELHRRLDATRAKRAPYLDPDYVRLLGGAEATRPTLERIAEEEAELERELAAAKRANRRNGVDVRAALDRFDELPLPARREVLQSVLSRVTVSRAPRRGRGLAVADRVEVVFHDDLEVVA